MKNDKSSSADKSKHVDCGRRMFVHILQHEHANAQASCFLPLNPPQNGTGSCDGR